MDRGSKPTTGTFCLAYFIDLLVYTNMEDLFGLAVDTDISEIIITGDFNFNTFDSVKLTLFVNLSLSLPISLNILPLY